MKYDKILAIGIATIIGSIALWVITMSIITGQIGWTQFWAIFFFTCLVLGGLITYIGYVVKPKEWKPSEAVKIQMLKDQIIISKTKGEDDGN